MHQVFYLTVDPERALGVEDLIPSFHIIHSEGSQLHDSIANHGIDIQRIEVEGDSQSTSKLFEAEKVKKYLKKHQVGVADILVFKNDSQIETIANTLGVHLINPPSSISKTYENKIEFTHFIEKLDIFSKPETKIYEKFSEAEYDQLTPLFGWNMVVQFMFGHSGNSTFYINNKEEFEELKTRYPLRKTKVAKLIKGVPYTINACITKVGIVVGGISEQITGIEMLTSSKGGTVGNDFTQRHLDDELRKVLIQKTMAFGELLRKEGHRGIFGLDLVLNLEQREFYIIEANIRQTMSCSYVSYLQRMEQVLPIMLWHILELIGHDYNSEFVCLDEETQHWINQELKEFVNGSQLEYNIKTNKPINASQIFFRNTKVTPVKINEPFPAGIYRMRGRLPNESATIEGEEKYPAIFRLREDGFSSLCLIKRGHSIIEAKHEGGFLINAAAENNIIPPLGEIGRLQILDSAFSVKDGEELSGWIVDAINAVYENMRLEEVKTQ